MKLDSVIDIMQENISFVMDADNEDNVVINNALESQILVWKALIETVKTTPVLYQKHLQGYSKRSEKYLMWQHIGTSLIPPMTGKNIRE